MGQPVGRVHDQTLLGHVHAGAVPSDVHDVNGGGGLGGRLERPVLRIVDAEMAESFVEAGHGSCILVDRQPARADKFGYKGEPVHELGAPRRAHCDFGAVAEIGESGVAHRVVDVGQSEILQKRAKRRAFEHPSQPVLGARPNTFEARQAKQAEEV